ncbi:class I lanthipeptide [Pontibacter actiniarum]|uniref:Uncharacterized protein n=1 Tax=Pontibacter actiniarum TaxID=323450 RepID=A0A1X9YS44_9BACT|nr:class I lanthipeptide [Pontibacter actiniarum]ARS35716.1 hypothetical protein CA264_09835 [Pontibacter actiniarum]
MKKQNNVNPLSLDKETIAKLDEKQLEALAGGAGDPDEGDEATCLFLTRNTVKELEADTTEPVDCCGTRTA